MPYNEKEQTGGMQVAAAEDIPKVPILRDVPVKVGEDRTCPACGKKLNRPHEHWGGIYRPRPA